MGTNVGSGGKKITPSRVMVRQDKGFAFEGLYLGVYVESNCPVETAQFARMFVQAGCFKANSPETADLVVFTGGDDVNPALYGEEPHPSVYYDEERDEREKELFNYCVDEGIPMLGICRGAQFGSVMMGGKLFQDVDNHNSPHSLGDIKTGEVIDKISSVHHQCVKANLAGGMEIIATSKMSTKRWLNDKAFQTGDHHDIEAFFYRDVCFLGIQGHPEYPDYDDYTNYCINLIDHFINQNPDLEYRNRVQRMKTGLFFLQDK